MKPARQKATVLLLGATAQVGVFALPRLLAAGYPVIAVSRRISAVTGKPCANGVCWLHPDALNGASDGEVGSETDCFLQDIQVLLSCGPVELAAQIAPRCPRLQRVVCFSTSSVYSKQSSADASERKLIAAIKRSEDALKQSCQARAIALVVLRPTLIYGCGLDRNVSRIARLARRFHFIPVAGNASGLRQPVHADDLAKLALGLLESADVPTMESPVGGGSVLTYRELVERIFAGIGLPAHILQIPPRVLANLARGVSWLGLADGLNAEFVYRQNHDLIFDDRRLRDQFGFDPRPFAPGVEDFTIPAQALALQPG